MTLKRKKNGLKDKNPKRKTLNAKTKLVPLLTLKRTNGLKTSYDATFEWVLNLFDPKFHFLETYDTKTQKNGLKDKNPKP